MFCTSDCKHLSRFGRCSNTRSVNHTRAPEEIDDCDLSPKSRAKPKVKYASKLIEPWPHRQREP